MMNFEKFILRHGEFGVQALVEQIERRDGIYNISTELPLEDRWNAVMQPLPEQQRLAA